jgi:hypothetical protein
MEFSAFSVGRLSSPRGFRGFKRESPVTKDRATHSMELKGGENMILTLAVRIVMFFITVTARLTVKFDR